jgi:hypothetical protein
MIDQRTAPYAALFLRLTLGSMFIAHLSSGIGPAKRGPQKSWSVTIRKTC